MNGMPLACSWDIKQKFKKYILSAIVYLYCNLEIVRNF